MPSYGDEMTRGFYLQNGGYYLALSDYIDLAVTGEIYTKGSWGAGVRSNYRKRYKYSGNFNVYYLSTVTGERELKDVVPEAYSVAKDCASTGLTHRIRKQTCTVRSPPALISPPAGTTITI